MVTRSNKPDYESLLSMADKARRNGFSQKPTISMAANRKPAVIASKEKKPDPKAVQAFIIKKQREEMQKQEALRRQKEHLLQLRNQNRKSAKAAKMMASRTKDNDFSKIVLKEDEIREKEMIEDRLRRNQVFDTKERMRQRIEMENEAASCPKKRKRKKSEYGRYPGEEDDDDEQLDYRSINRNPHYYADDNFYNPPQPKLKQKSSATQSVQTKKKKPVSSLGFDKLMEIAEKKEIEEKKPTLLEEIEYAKSDAGLFRAKRLEQKKRLEEQQKENLRRLNAEKEEENKRMKSTKEHSNRASISKKSTKDPVPCTSGYLKTNNACKSQGDSDRMSKNVSKKQPPMRQELYESESSEEERDDRFSSSRATLMPQKNQKNDLFSTKNVVPNKLPNKKLPPNRFQERVIPKREPEKRIPLKKPETAVRPNMQKYTAESSDDDDPDEYKPTKVKHLKSKYPEYVPQPVKKERYSPEPYSPENEYEKRLKQKKNLSSQKPPVPYKPTKIKQEEYSDEDDDAQVSKVSKTPPVNRNKYTDVSENLYERNKKQLQMRRHREEYSPPPFKKSGTISKRRDEEYSPTEPYMNGNKTANNLKMRQSDAYASYKPTSRQHMNKYSRDSESPENVRPYQQPMKKQLPIGATYKKQNVRDSSPLYDKHANITTGRLLNNPSFGRLMQNKETERRNPNETRSKLSNFDEKKIKMNAQRVMQQPGRKLPPIGLNYRRGMYGEKNDIQYQESEEDEEDDDEMREFIDDGDYEDVMDDDYSKYIREIFGYDKRKYVDEDDDDIMEANFEQQQQEELRSAKIGILEDLEDMRLEAEEKRRKAVMRKKHRQIDDDDEDD